ncbi:M15 family metallopeptidase [Duganella callida]|uniref:D-alanyl-D-alanine carboxypeptidase family protein n=1 Tax=Duganella callida TaxID=2561932 RepID=A0A4Y9S6R5_9BURK|nr:M15 family metallopeptidase [Duganella callida]TFW17244.1 D-alanyl-D-alanine carboxypeptidase family protein [Duganella callida]
MNAPHFDEWELTGRTRRHVQQHAQPRFAARPEVAAAFLALREAALADGIDLLPIASYRPFDNQLRIWNNKFSGEKTLYDQAGQPRDYASLTPPERVRAVLGWSGLPGATRRHWGTDIDVFDRAAMPPGYHTRLLPQEVAPGGVYERLHAWLDVHIARFGFFRPYRAYRGGMYPEPWHLSYAPSAQAALDAYRAQGVDLLARVLREADMLGRELVLEMLPDLFRDHVLSVDTPDAG